MNFFKMNDDHNYDDDNFNAIFNLNVNSVGIQKRLDNATRLTERI